MNNCNSTFKIYNDGSHYVGSFSYPAKNKNAGGESVTDNETLNELYYETILKKIPKSAQPDYIRLGALAVGEDYSVEFIVKYIERIRLNILSRRRRFTRKANLNDWNYFVTITYDDKKMTAEEFQIKLKKTLSNFHTRRGWKYMGTFEKAPETHRIHFHGLIYIPDGQYVGKSRLVTTYNFKSKKTSIMHENSFFAETFGRNDFAPMNQFELKFGRAVDYVLKYISKTAENIFYSRGIPTYVEMPYDTDDVIVDMYHFGLHYLMYDDILLKNKNFIMRC